MRTLPEKNKSEDMHSISDMGVSNVPAFLTKLWTLVEDTNTDDMICWDTSGVSFHIYDQARFAKEILPLYFKHSNIASFIRQLNMYGFRKVIHMESGAIKSEWDDVEFHHPYFIRGEESLLVNIKRKQSAAPTVKPDTGVRLNHDDINRVLSDVQGMKQQQDTFTTKLDGMKRENEALWREVASLRQKHMKQQQIVNKLIEFMIHLVGGKKGLKTGLPLKRKIPLMISDSQQPAGSKRQRYGKAFSIEEVPQSYVVNSPESSSTVTVESTSPLSSGPEIHDVTDILMASSRPSLTATSSARGLNVTNPRSRGSSGMSTVGRSTTLTPSQGKVQTKPSSYVQKSKSENLPDPLDLSLDSNDLSSLVDSNFFQNMEPSASTSHGFDSSLDKTEMNTQIDSMQDHLEDLKDLLSGTQYQFDPSTILGLFNNENTIPSIPTSLEHLAEEDKDGEASGNTDPNTIVGNELVSFPLDNSLPLPTAFPDLTDLISPDNPNPNTQPSYPQEEDDYITIDPMSFVNLPGQENSSKSDK